MVGRSVFFNIYIRLYLAKEWMGINNYLREFSCFLMDRKHSVHLENFITFSMDCLPFQKEVLGGSVNSA